MIKSPEQLSHPVASIKPLLNKQPSHEAIQLYDSTNLHELKWPANEEGDYARRFLTPIIQHGVPYYIDNIKTEMKALKIGPYVFPITINDAEYDNAYVCSPYGYISYALDYIDRLKNPLLKMVLRGIVNMLKKVMQWGSVNRVVFVNNWLFSTNLYPDLEPSLIHAMTTYLKQRFPDHAIAFRSLETYTHQDLIKILKKQGFDALASRQVYLTDSAQASIFETRIFKSDLKLLKKTNYELVEMDAILPEDYPRLLELYQAVYLDKHSRLNPQFNCHFIELAIQNRLLEMTALKKDGKIDGVVGYLTMHGKMFCPFFGYDVKKPQELGLYRLLSTLLMLKAQKHQLFFHQSSGAAFYKTVRRAQTHFEYTIAYTRHIPYRRRLAWLFLKSILNSIGVPFMKKFS